MNACCVDIKDMLIAESSLSLTFGDNLFISREPASPDNCVTLYEAPGAIPDLCFDGALYFRDAFQVRVRNNTYLNGMAQIYAIMEFLQGKYNEVLNGTYYGLIRVYMTPNVLEYDKNNRVIFVMSLEAQRRNV